MWLCPSWPDPSTYLSARCVIHVSMRIRQAIRAIDTAPSTSAQPVATDSEAVGILVVTFGGLLLLFLFVAL